MTKRMHPRLSTTREAMALIEGLKAKGHTPGGATGVLLTAIAFMFESSTEPAEAQIERLPYIMSDLVAAIREHVPSQGLH